MTPGAHASGSRFRVPFREMGDGSYAVTDASRQRNSFTRGVVAMSGRMCVWGIGLGLLLAAVVQESAAQELTVRETGEEIVLTTPRLEAAIRKRGYVTGVAANSLLDKATGARDLGFGLDIIDWIMEPGSDEAYRGQLDKELIYTTGNVYHGKTLKRSIEGPQICTQAKQLSPVVIRGKDYLGVRQEFTYRTAAPGKKTGSRWEQLLVFPKDARYFVSMDRIHAVNSSEAMFLRLDMPGHIKHKQGDSFSEIYRSYHGRIPSSEFTRDFAPDEKFNYTRGRDKTPERFIRAYRIRDKATGKEGPWLAGMTLDPGIVSEAWCHQRGYVCFIEEFGGRPVAAGEMFSAAFIVGYFDSIEEMHAVYDKYKGHSGLKADETGWSLTK